MILSIGAKGPRAMVTMQYVQWLSHPSCIFTKARVRDVSKEPWGPPRGSEEGTSGGASADTRSINDAKCSFS